MSATTPSYTGNVSEWTWQHAGRDENTYAFAYDSFARLTDTRHYEAGALTDRFAEKGCAAFPIWKKAFPLPTQQPLCAGCTARLSRRRWGFWKALLRR